MTNTACRCVASWNPGGCRRYCHVHLTQTQQNNPPPLNFPSSVLKKYCAICGNFLSFSRHPLFHSELKACQPLHSSGHQFVVVIVVPAGRSKVRPSFPASLISSFLSDHLPLLGCTHATLPSLLIQTRTISECGSPICARPCGTFEGVSGRDSAARYGASAVQWGRK